MIKHKSGAGIMTIAEFQEEVRSGMFIDGDGFGYLGTETEEFKQLRIYPSESRLIRTISTQATHVWWYNK